MRFVPLVARWFMGLIFFIFGLNGFLNFIPVPPDIPAPAMNFYMCMAATGFMLQLISATQVVAGALMLANRYVPLALVLIAPVIVNIFLFHIFVETGGFVLGALLLLAECYLGWAYRESFKAMLSMNAKPS
jgi:uncharacterized membrane protein YphA (DoxX/SURF4 family)